MPGVGESHLARYQAILQAIGDGVAVFDLDGRMILANDALARIGSAPGADQMLRDLSYYRDRYDLVSPEGRIIPAEEWPIAAILRGESVSERRLVVRRRMDGQETPVSVRGTPLFDSEGRPESGLIILRDLTAQELAEEKLNRNERKYRELLETLDDGFCVIQMLFDRDGRAADYRFLEANAAFEKQTGFRDAMGRNARTLVPDLDESRFRLYGNVAITGEPIRFEDHAPAMGRWFDVYASRMGNPEDRKVALIFKDVTRRKRTEESLHKFALLVEASNDFIALADSSGVCTFLNAGGANLLALPTGECLGRHLVDLVLPEDAGDFRKLEGVAREAGGGHGEFRFRKHATGEAVPVWCNMFQLRSPDTGKPVALALVARDLTQVREKEEQLRQVQKNEAIGRLAGGVAHDFNNLLTAINGYSDILLETMPADDAKRGFVEEIQAAGRKAASLTSQLLAYSRKQAMQSRILDLNDLVRDSARLLRRIIGEDIVLHLELDPALLQVRADPSQIHQTLLNLCIRSRDAMPGGGDLTIATRNSQEDSDAARNKPGEGRPMVVLEVSDTGIGMTPETRESIFEPFSTTRLVSGPARGAGGKSAGAALGLSSVEDFVRQSGGRIEARSEPGQGSTFSIHLPGAEAAEPVERAPATAVPSPAETRKGNILLVEDEDAVRKFVRNVLEREGYVVSEARDGLEGKTLLESTGARPDLLLTDVVMPRMGGIQLARSVRKSHPEIPILLMSGYTEEDFNREEDSGEALPIMKKPFTPQALLDRILGLIGVSGKS